MITTQRCVLVAPALKVIIRENHNTRTDGGPLRNREKTDFPEIYKNVLMHGENYKMKEMVKRLKTFNQRKITLTYYIFL